MLSDAKKPDLPEWLREHYPFLTRCFCGVRPRDEHDDGEPASYSMSFLDEGAPDAPPVVLVHGNAAWSFLFRNLVPRLASKFRVVAPDHIGFGLSDKPAHTAYHTLQQHIRNFTALVQALELRRVTLVAHGWGGPIALGYAGTHPENVARLVLVNTWAGNLPHIASRKKPLAQRLAGSGRIGAFLDRVFKLSINSSLSLRTHRPISDLILEAYTYPFANPASRAAIHAFDQMFFEPDAQTRALQDEIQANLRKIDAPADILCGAYDPLLSKLPAYLLRDSLRHTAEPVFLEAAHLIPEEAGDALAETVLRGITSAGSTHRTGSVFKILD